MVSLLFPYCGPWAWTALRCSLPLPPATGIALSGVSWVCGGSLSPPTQLSEQAVPQPECQQGRMGAAQQAQTQL